jgi:hypothetical protein
MKVIAFWDIRFDGWSINLPVYDDPLRFIVYPNDTDEAIIARQIERVIPREPGVPADYHVIEQSDLPTDRTFRYAWAWQGSRMDVDMPLARGIHMDKIRKVRNTELVAKDITFMRAVEAGDASAQSTIGTEKQVLRDIPATFDITTDVDTPEKLKAKWPTELPARE